MRAQRLWDQGRRADAAAVFDAEIARDPTLPDPYFDQARLYLASGELARARDYLGAARLLVHNPINQAWYFAIEAELAQTSGDWDGWLTNVDRAAQIIQPDQTGAPLYFYGPDVANLSTFCG